MHTRHYDYFLLERTLVSAAKEKHQRAEQMKHQRIKSDGIGDGGGKFEECC